MLHDIRFLSPDGKWQCIGTTLAERRLFFENHMKYNSSCLRLPGAAGWKFVFKGKGKDMEVTENIA